LPKPQAGLFEDVELGAEDDEDHEEAVQKVKEGRLTLPADNRFPQIG
jgi:hypothetical protein